MPLLSNFLEMREGGRLIPADRQDRQPLDIVARRPLVGRRSVERFVMKQKQPPADLKAHQLFKAARQFIRAALDWSYARLAVGEAKVRVLDKESSVARHRIVLQTALGLVVAGFRGRLNAVSELL